jgi:hypothetical protein
MMGWSPGPRSRSKRPQEVQEILLVFLGKPIEPLHDFVGFRLQLHIFGADVSIGENVNGDIESGERGRPICFSSMM